MSDKAVELTVAGQRCRVVTSANENELELLASMVEEKLAAVVQPGRPVDTRTMLLAAVALANDAREQRQRADAIAVKAKSALKGLLTRVDEALAESAVVTDRRVTKKRVVKSKQQETDGPS